jgi:hypothetical protein
LEQDDKAYERKKSKSPRTQGRNPLPRKKFHTNSVGTKTKLPTPLETRKKKIQIEIPVVEETTVQTKGLIPTDFLAPLETIDVEIQIDAPTTKETVVQIEEEF